MNAMDFVRRGATLTMVAAMGAVLPACTSGTQWVQSASVSQTTVNGDNYVELEAMLNTGSTTFAAVGLPIMNTSGTVYGQVNVVPGTSGTAQISVLLDADKLVKLPTGSHATALPNGYAFPVAGVSFTQYEIGTGGSAFYEQISTDEQTATVGVALVISGFTSSVAASAFVPYTVSTSFAGMAGGFTSPTPSQSGFGLFANVNFSTTHRAMPVMIPTPINSSDAVHVREALGRLNAQHAYLVIR